MALNKKKNATLIQLFSWAFYDWANSPFFAVIQTFVFATYFTEAVAANSVTGTAIWGYTLGAAGLVIALSGPFIGAIADQYGRRKPWIFSFASIAILAIASLWFVKPDPAYTALPLILVFIG